MIKNRHIIGYLFVASLFLGITAPDLFSDGMFIDGLIYAAISKNMAHGWGTFWKPYLSTGLFPVFYAHPPLGIWIQSLWFRLFGDSIYVERCYSLVVCTLTGYTVVLIWKTLTGTVRNGWIPLLFWVTVSVVPRAYANNMLENTMTLFVTTASWLYLKHRGNRRLWIIVLSGLILSLAALTKGPVALYIWILPVCIWLIRRNERFLSMSLKTVLLVASTLLPLVLLYTISTDARELMRNYFENQVMESILHMQTVNSRFYILSKFIQYLAAPLAIAVAAIASHMIRHRSVTLPGENIRKALPFLMVAMCGTIPIMISMKQSGFYTLSVYPFTALFLGYALLPVIQSLFHDLMEKGYRIITGVTAAMVVLSLSIVALYINNEERIRRDRDMIHDTYLIINEIGTRQTIGICPDLYTEWSLHGYFARYGSISLEIDKTGSHRYYLEHARCSQLPGDAYEEEKIGLVRYRLYREK